MARTPEDIRCEDESLRHFARVYEQVKSALSGSNDKLGHMAEAGLIQDAWYQDGGPRLSSLLWTTLGGELASIRADDSEYVPGPRGGDSDAPGSDEVGGSE